jgi:hypothetical protein
MCSKCSKLSRNGGHCKHLKKREKLAPRARFELATLRLTAECSTVELPGNWMAISSNCSRLRGVLFNRDDCRLGHTGHNKPQSYFLGPLAPIFNILLQLLRVLVRDISVRVADPELFQVPRHTILSKMSDRPDLLVQEK